MSNSDKKVTTIFSLVTISNNSLNSIFFFSFKIFLISIILSLNYIVGTNTLFTVVSAFQYCYAVLKHIVDFEVIGVGQQGAV